MSNQVVKAAMNEDEIQRELNRKADRKDKITRLLPYAGIVFLFILFSTCTGGKFLTKDNMLTMVNQCFTLTIVVMGGAFLYAIGGLDMAIGSVMAVSMMVCVTILNKLSAPLWLGLLAAFVTAVFCLSITCVCKLKLKLPTFVGSMCVMNIANSVIQVVTAKEKVILNYSQFSHMNNPTVRIVVIVALFIVGFYLFNYTAFGKNLKYLGGNSKAAKISGINEMTNTWFAYVAVAVCLVVAGWFSVLRAGEVTASMSGSLNLDVMTAIVLGGFPLSGGANCRYEAPIVGAVMVTMLTNGLVLMGLGDAWGYFFKGVLFVTVIALTYDRSKGKLIS